MSESSNKDKVSNLGLIMKKRREALNKSIRDIEQESGVSKTLISQLENGLRDNVPKLSTLKKIEKALLYKKCELQKVAGVIENKEESSDVNPNWQDDLRIFLAIDLGMNAANIQRSIHYIQGLRLVQEVEEGQLGERFPELKDKMAKLSL